MLTNCKKCKDPNTDDNLSPEGECYDCSNNLPPNTDLAPNIKETFDNIADVLAKRTGDLKVRVKASMHKAAKEAGNGGYN